jgi:predicted transcriptional regulator
MLIFTQVRRPPQSEPVLSRRERQIMDILYAMGRATAAEVQERLPGEPSYSAVRTILRVLERKGHIKHIEEGQRYVYLPDVPRDAASKSAIQRLISTFFDGSAKAAAAALIDPQTSQLSEDDLQDLERMIQKARKDKGPR